MRHNFAAFCSAATTSHEVSFQSPSLSLAPSQLSVQNRIGATFSRQNLIMQFLAAAAAPSLPRSSLSLSLPPLSLYQNVHVARS